MIKSLRTIGLLVAFSFVLVANQAKADDMIIDMLNKREDGAKMVYSEDIARVDVGDTITWLPTSKGHNVEFKAMPDGVDIPKKSKINKEYSYTFEAPGIYYYWCTPHKGMGMIGLVIVGEDTSNVDAVTKVKTLGKSKKKLKKLLAEL
tara:strand:+ start:901 stop:1344 length:444 start_codon:yes stop_codon:yes gene_type:complete